MKLERIRKKKKNQRVVPCWIVSIITRSFTSRRFIPSWGTNDDFIEVDVALTLKDDYDCEGNGEKLGTREELGNGPLILLSQVSKKEFETLKLTLLEYFII